MQKKQMKKALLLKGSAKSSVIGGSKEGQLPNFIIIGAQKCGTTSLHYYLDLHPQISMSREKGLDFFIGERNWQKGIEWYKSNFTGKALAHGESSPNYTAYPMWKGVAERMYATIPGAKLIYVVRNPVDRIISGYFHNCLKGRETRKIEDVLLDFDNTLVFRSKYFMQVEQFLKYYPKSKILILELEELHKNPRWTSEKIFKFLDVDESFYSPDFEVILHKSSNTFKNNSVNRILRRLSETKIAKQTPLAVQIQIRSLLSRMQRGKPERPVLSGKLQERLIEHLRDDINCFREFTGKDVEDWSV